MARGVWLASHKPVGGEEANRGIEILPSSNFQCTVVLSHLSAVACSKGSLQEWQRKALIALARHSIYKARAQVLYI